MKQLLLLIPFIAQWSFYNKGQLVLTADETDIDSVTVSMHFLEDLSFGISQTDKSLTITPSDLERTYVWQLVDSYSLRQMAQLVGKKQITAEEFWQYYIDMIFDPRYDLDCGVIELNYEERAITPGTYTIIIAGCDSLGYRTSDFTTKRIGIGTHRRSMLYAAQPAVTDTLYYFEFWKDGRIVAELPSDAVDSITVSEVPKPVTLDLAVMDVGKTNATISVSPSYSVPYYFDYVQSSVFESFPDDETFANRYIAFLKENYQDFAPLLSHEQDSYTFTAQDGLASGTDYYAFAFAVNMADTTYVPHLAKQKFTTWQQSFIDGFTFDFKYLSESNRIQISPSIDDAPYVWSIWPESEVNRDYGGSPERAWKENVSITAGLGFIDTGISYVNIAYECLWPGKYYLTVAGYDNGQTTPVSVYAVTVE